MYEIEILVKVLFIKLNYQIKQFKFILDKAKRRRINFILFLHYTYYILQNIY